MGLLRLCFCGPGNVKIFVIVSAVILVAEILDIEARNAKSRSRTGLGPFSKHTQEKGLPLFVVSDRRNPVPVAC